MDETIQKSRLNLSNVESFICEICWKFLHLLFLIKYWRVQFLELPVWLDWTESLETEIHQIVDLRSQVELMAKLWASDHKVEVEGEEILSRERVREEGEEEIQSWSEL